VWLRVLLLIIIGVMIYRFFGGKVPILDKEEKESNKEQDVEKIEATSACAVCGTYVTEDDALIYQKKAYCSSECLEKVK